VRRRDFIPTLAGTVIGYSLPLRAQQKAIPVIGFLNSGSASASERSVTAFREGLAQLLESGRHRRTSVFVDARLRRACADLLKNYQRTVGFRRSGRGAAELDGGSTVANGTGTVSALSARAMRVALTCPANTIRPLIRGRWLISLGPDFADLWHRAGDYVDKILKGEKAAGLPVWQPTGYHLAVNPTTAAALGITIPPSILAQADEVIE
jgi:hypothetical protein